MTIAIADLVAMLAGALLAMIGYLLKRKDEEQARLIDDLYEKHHQDADRLHKVELKLASDHYLKSELDSKFDKVEQMMKKGFENLGTKFDVLSATLVAHMTQEEIKK